MNELLREVSENLQSHLVKVLTVAGFTLVGWYFGKRRARSQWRKKEFLNRINISLNVLHEGKLMIRTILEKTCDDVFLNSVAAEAVIASARNTTPHDALLPLPEKDYWYYLNSILNEVSEKFAQGQVRRDMGQPVLKDVYLVCLTCECAGEMRTRKIRAMLVRQSALESLSSEDPKLENATHITRWETLRQMAAAWKSTPYKFQKMEICL